MGAGTLSSSWVAAIAIAVASPSLVTERKTRRGAGHGGGSM